MLLNNIVDCNRDRRHLDQPMTLMVDDNVENLNANTSMQNYPDMTEAEVVAVVVCSLCTLNLVANDIAVAFFFHSVSLKIVSLFLALCFIYFVCTKI